VEENGEGVIDGKKYERISAMEDEKRMVRKMIRKIKK
jgi:hypothetical protein